MLNLKTCPYFQQLQSQKSIKIVQSLGSLAICAQAHHQFIYLFGERAKRARQYQGWIMQNRVYVIYIYICMYVWMVRMLFKRARRERFTPKNTAIQFFTPVYSETTALSKPYFILKLQSMRKFLLKRLFSRHKKLIRLVTMALKTLFQT